jgi:hypothetical protein
MRDFAEGKRKCVLAVAIVRHMARENFRLGPATVDFEGGVETAPSPGWLRSTRGTI